MFHVSFRHSFWLTFVLTLQWCKNVTNAQAIAFASAGGASASASASAGATSFTTTFGFNNFNVNPFGAFGANFQPGFGIVNNFGPQVPFRPLPAMPPNAGIQQRPFQPQKPNQKKQPPGQQNPNRPIQQPSHPQHPIHPQHPNRPQQQKQPNRPQQHPNHPHQQQQQQQQKNPNRPQHPQQQIPNRNPTGSIIQQPRPHQPPTNGNLKPIPNTNPLGPILPSKPPQTGPPIISPIPKPPHTDSNQAIPKPTQTISKDLLQQIIRERRIVYPDSPLYRHSPVNQPSITPNDPTQQIDPRR